LVATVAGQNLDMYRLDRTHKNLLDLDDDLLLKEKLGRHFVDRDTLLNRNLDLTTLLGRDTFFNTRDLDLTTILGRDTIFGRHTILSLDEIIVHPLFRVYMNIPLFRKFMIEHPVVFRKYVESPLFQKFWTVPRFQMYFWNPVLFYKYIVPQLHIIKKVVLTRGIYNVDDVFTTKKTFLPYVLNKFNKDFTLDTTTDLRVLLHKIYKNLDIDMVRDVNVFDKDIKIDDERILPVLKTLDMPFGIDKLFERRDLVKDLLLKKIILTKIFGDKIFGDRKVLDKKVLDLLFDEHREVIPEVYKHLFDLKNIMTTDVLDTLFHTKKTFVPEIVDTLFDEKKVLHPTLFDILKKDLITKRFLNRDVFDVLFKGKKDIIVPDVLETVFGKKIYKDDILRTLLGDKVVFPEVYKHDLDYDFDLLKDRKISPRFDTLTKKVIVDDIKKDDLVDDLLLKKDLIKDIKF